MLSFFELKISFIKARRSYVLQLSGSLLTTGKSSSLKVAIKTSNGRVLKDYTQFDFRFSAYIFIYVCSFTKSSGCYVGIRVLRVKLELSYRYLYLILIILSVFQKPVFLCRECSNRSIDNRMCG